LSSRGIYRKYVASLFRPSQRNHLWASSEELRKSQCVAALFEREWNLRRDIVYSDCPIYILMQKLLSNLYFDAEIVLYQIKTKVLSCKRCTGNCLMSCEEEGVNSNIIAWEYYLGLQRIHSYITPLSQQLSWQIQVAWTSYSSVNPTLRLFPLHVKILTSENCNHLIARYSRKHESSRINASMPMSEISSSYLSYLILKHFSYQTSKWNLASIIGINAEVVIYCLLLKPIEL
jgi:hypothetical protein